MIRRFCLPGLCAIGFGLMPLTANAGLWTNADAATRSTDSNAARFALDRAALRTSLAGAPHEALLDRSYSIQIPMPDGSQQQFSIVESPIVPAAIGARFPGMQTFKLRGIDDPGASGRADMTARGFRAMLQTSRGTIFIDPEPGAGNFYRSVMRQATAARTFSCGVHGRADSPVAHVGRPATPANRMAGNYQTYRIAVAATHEYVAAVGGTEAAARAEIVTAINRVNQIYERDLGIRLRLVANDGDLLEEEGDSCFTNDDGIAMLAENQVWLDDRIGSSAYDIGHVFSTGSGGVASLGSACQAGAKARGTTGLPNPTGDLFYIDFVAHEIGHQLNADHSFNGSSGLCGGQRNAPTAFEPGSGSTIMGYAGICGAEDLQPNSDATFHASSISDIDAFTAGGGSCHGTVFNGNSDPALGVLTPHTIPAQTAFRLDVSASDVDGDSLSYQWDQLDSNGTATNSTTFGNDLGNNPLFRSFVPQTDSYRDFPALGTQVRGQTDDAEALPAVARTLTFRVTARDGNSGQDTADVTLNVVAGTGFRVVDPAGGSVNTTVTPYTVTWSTAGTESAPVNCTEVDIDLLTFSNSAYAQYSVHSIATNEPNDGSADVTFASSHPRARILVKCSNNVFYDISDGDLAVTGTSGTYSSNAFTTFFNSDGITVSRSASDGFLMTANSAGMFDPFASGGRSTAARPEDCRRRVNGDASAAEPWWLMSLVGLVLLVRLRRRYGWQ